MSEERTCEELRKRIVELEEQNKMLQFEATKYRSLFDYFPHGITVSDDQGNVLEANSISEQLLGISKEEHAKRNITGQEWRIIRNDGTEMPPDEWASVIALKEQRVVTNCEMGIVKPNGQKTWINVTAAPLSIQGHGVVITYNDITEKKNAQSELWESEKRYKKIFNNKYVPMLVIEPETGSIIDANPASTGFYGWLNPELTKMNIKDINTLPWDDISNAMQKTKNEKYKLFRFQHRLKDGSIRDVEVASAPVEYDGKINLFSIIHDITKRKRMEEELRESEEKYRILFEHTSEGLFVAQDGKIVFNNPRTSELLGYSTEELQSRSFIEFIHEDDAEMVMDRHLRRVKGENPPAPYAFRIIHKDGLIRWVQLNVVMIQWSGKPATLCFISDITGRKKTESELIKKESQLRQIIDLVPHFIFVKDEMGKFEIVNKATAELFGTTVENLTGRRESEFVANEEEIKHLRIDDLEVIKSGQTKYISEESLTDFKNNIRYLQTTKVPFKFSATKRPSLLGVSVDITDRKQIEETLKLNYELLNIAGKTAKFGGWSVDLKNNTCKWSEAVADIHDVPHGYAPLVQEAINFYAPEWREKITQCFSDCAKDGIPYDEEMEIITPKGKRVWVRITGRAVKNEKGKTIKVQGSFQDITERKLAEQALLENEKILNITGQMAKIGGWELYPETMKVTWTDETYRIHELPKSIKPPLEDAINFWHPEDRPILRKAIEQALDKGIPYDLQLRFTTAKGKNLYARTKCNPVLRDGKVIKLQGFFQDITERKRAEIENRKLQVQLDQAQKMESIGSLAGGIAHDFNNILSPIIGMSELLLEDLEPDSLVYENAQEIYKAGNRAKNLVSQILSFSRQAEHEMMPVKLQRVLKEVLKLCRSTIPANISIVQDIQQNCGSIWADATQLHQIGMNLITNAYHAVHDKNGEITVQLKELTLGKKEMPSLSVGPGNYAMLSVSDNGTGMSEEIKSKIFEPYFTTKEKGKGTGLGLAVVYGIVKEFGGDIQVLSMVGTGTTFNIYLPLMKKTGESEFDKTGMDIKTGHEHILLVDDEPPIARLGQLMLERLGYTVTSRVSSIEALEAFKENPDKFDIVVSDMSMPEMTGDLLAYEIKKIRPKMPVVICTGFSERINKEKAEEIGVDGFLMKPVVKSEMAKTVRKVLDEAK